MINRLKIGFFINVLLFIVNNVLAQGKFNQFTDNDINVLNEIIKMSDDTIYVSNIDENNKSDNNLFHFYNKQGNRIIQNGYEFAYPFVGKSAIVKKNNKWGVINRTGELIFLSESNSPVKLSSYEKYAIFDDDKIIYNLKNGKKKEGYILCAEPSSPNFYIKEITNRKYNLISSKEDKSIFKEDMDSIFSQNFLMYDDNPNLLILKRRGKYGLFLSNGDEILKIKYEKMKFLGNYIMVYERKVWNYFLFVNDQLKFIVSSEYECKTPTYQKNTIGVYSKGKKYNILKMNGESLSQDFDYIYLDGTIGFHNNSTYIFNSRADFYPFYTKDNKEH